MTENKMKDMANTIGSWLLSVITICWSFYEAHTAAIVGLFAIAAWSVTIYMRIRRERRKNAPEPETDI